MAIDIKTPDSDGWWMDFLWQQLKSEQKRYDLLEAFRRGCPPLPRSLPSSLRAATTEILEMSQFNVADLIVQAMVERMGVRAIRTAASDDPNGDSVAMEVWNNANMPVILADAFRAMAGMSIGYIAVAVDGEGTPVATYEDPRQMTTWQDPVNPVITRVAFKLYYDPMSGREYAILLRDGQKRVASHPAPNKKPKIGMDGTKRYSVSFVPSQFDMHPVEDTDAAEGFTDGFLSQDYPSLDGVPVVPIPNRDEVGEFETHLKHLRQINHIILQGIVIATFQAFRQRALQVKNGEALPDIDPATGEAIDYDDLLSADPGAIWLLPVGAEIWESGQVDLSGILQMAKDSVSRLFAATRTPFSMGSSDAVNQSAEGAQQSQNGLVFKVKDRENICAPRLARVASFLLRLAGQADRANPAKILIDWFPPERYSLQEMAVADAAAVSLPDEQKWQRIWQMTPDDIAISSAQKSAQLFRLAALGAPAAPATVPDVQPAG